MNEEFEIVKNEYNTTLEMEDIWNNPVVDFITSHIGLISSSVDKGITKILEMRQKKKLEELFEIILENDDIGIDDINDVECIMEVARTIDVVNKLIRNDKVKYFGRLLKNSILDSERNVDEFEEILNKLNELSLREINMLYLLYNEERKVYMLNNENDEVFSPKKSWNSFIETAKKKYGFNESEIISIMLGIMRTGFCIAEWKIDGLLIMYTSPEYKKMLKKIG